MRNEPYPAGTAVRFLLGPKAWLKCTGIVLSCWTERIPDFNTSRYPDGYFTKIVYTVLVGDKIYDHVGQGQIIKL